MAFPKEVQGRLGVGVQELASSRPYLIHRSLKPPFWAKALMLLQRNRPILQTVTGIVILITQMRK